MPDISKIKIKTSDSDQGTIYNIKDSKAYDEIANKPGEITTGKQYTIDEQIVIAEDGAEAFNDLANNKALGRYSHAEGASTSTIAYGSHAEGSGTTASGECSHAEGRGTAAVGGQSHAEGRDTTTLGVGSHAEGSETTASGSCSHAENFYTTASGSYSHAEGNRTFASGTGSHAEGDHTKASSINQHVQGKYNVEDVNNTYAFIIGNGTADNTRHNAFAVDWNGLIYVNGASTGVDVSTLAPQSTTYNKTEVDTALAAKLNISDVDSALSSTSTNPVQNKAVQAPVARLVDAGAKNLLKIAATSQTINGVTFTVNDDGTITANGTATALIALAVSTSRYPSGQYVLSGCPQTGSNSTYRLDIVDYTTGTPVVVAIDVGNGVSFELSNEADYRVRIRIANGQTVNNLVFKPMLCTAADYAISQEFVPFAKSNYELTQVTEPIPRLVDAGAKNLLIIADQNVTAGGFSGVAKDGILTILSGTATGTPFSTITMSSMLLPPGNYFCSGCPANGSDTTYRLVLNTSSDGTHYVTPDNMTDYGYGFAFTLSTQTYVKPVLAFQNGYVASNLIFKPMICTDEDYAISQEFVPYAPSNRELYNAIRIDPLDTSTFSSLSEYADTLVSKGTYTFFVPNNNSLTDVPMNNASAIVTVKKYNSSTAVMDFVAISTTYQMYRYSKIKTSGTWRSWYRYEGTAVT